MSKARRSVGPEIIEQYDEFTAKIKQQWSSSGESSAHTYDIDAAAEEQAREDSMLDGVDDEPVPSTGGDEE